MDQQHHPDRRDIDRQPMKRARQEDGDYREALEDDEIDGPRLPPAAVADQPEMEMVVRAEAEEDEGNAMDEDAHAARAPPPPSEPLSYNGGGVVVVDEVADGGGPQPRRMSSEYSVDGDDDELDGEGVVSGSGAADDETDDSVPQNHADRGGHPPAGRFDHHSNQRADEAECEGVTQEKHASATAASSADDDREWSSTDKGVSEEVDQQRIQVSAPTIPPPTRSPQMDTARTPLLKLSIDDIV
jgi:hypothetical protein